MEKPRESSVSGDTSSLEGALSFEGTPSSEEAPSSEGAPSPEGVPSFEGALEELESIVERMEDGESSLEESLTLFERGMDLTRRCQKALDDAEQRIRTLADSDSPPVEADAAEGPAADG